MDAPTESNNDRLRALVATLDLPQAVLLTIFNRGLGARACTASVWRGWLEPSHSPRFVSLDDEMWQHAQRQFDQLARTPKPNAPSQSNLIDA
nr:hypothetical protein [uncultured Caldimonas sp.]